MPSFGGWGWVLIVGILSVPAIVVAVILMISHLDSFDMNFDRTANVSCPHCGGETPPRRRVCRHCGGELQ
jgi:ribosomal protein L40E